MFRSCPVSGDASPSFFHGLIIIGWLLSRKQRTAIPQSFNLANKPTWELYERARRREEGEDGWRGATRMIYSDSQSPSLNDSRGGELPVVGKRYYRARWSLRDRNGCCLEGCHCHQAAVGELGESVTGVARYLPSGGFNPPRWVRAIVARMPPVPPSSTPIPTLRSRRISLEITLTQSDYFMDIDFSRS